MVAHGFSRRYGTIDINCRFIYLHLVISVSLNHISLIYGGTRCVHVTCMVLVESEETNCG